MTDDELRAYIYSKLSESRQFKSTKERIVSSVKFERPEAPDATLWRAKAIADLQAFANKDAWAAVYIRCGACLRGWQEWIKDNPVTDSGWAEKAAAIVLEKRWI